MGSLVNGSPPTQSNTFTKNLGSAIEVSKPFTDTQISKVFNRFIPTRLDGLIFWLDASDTATITKDALNKVSAWRDKSNRNFGPLAQSNNNSRPVHLPNRQNGMPGVVFTRTSGHIMLFDEAIFSDYPVTVFIVAKCFNDAVTQALLWVGDSTTNEADEAACDWSGASGGDPVRILMRTDGAAQIARSSTGYIANQTCVGTFRFSKIDHRSAQVNDGAVGRNTVSRIMQNYNRTAIGRQSDSAPTSTSFDGDIYEIIVYNKNLSELDVKKVQEYLFVKWGIVV